MYRTYPSSSLLDTNVLVYAYYQQSPQHAACRALLDGAGLCVAPRNLSEFFAIVTSPKRVTQAKSPIEALDLVSGFSFPNCHFCPIAPRMPLCVFVVFYLILGVSIELNDCLDSFHGRSTREGRTD